MPEVQKLNEKHDAILEYIFAHPEARRGDVARYFGVTESWLSIIVNSSVFQAKLAALKEEYFGDVVVPIRQRMHAIADLALERVAETLEMNPSGKYALETADKILHRMGYAPQRVGVQVNQQNNTKVYNGVPAETVARARANFGRRQLNAVHAEELPTGPDGGEGGALLPSPAMDSLQAEKEHSEEG